MEKPNNEIDKIIREKLLDYEENTSPHFWARLRGRLYGRSVFNGLFFSIVVLSGMVFWMIVPKPNVDEIAGENQFHQKEVPETSIVPISNEKGKDKQTIKKSKKTFSNAIQMEDNEIEPVQLASKNRHVEEKSPKSNIGIPDVQTCVNEIKRNNYKANHIAPMQTFVLTANETPQLINNNGIGDFKYGILHNSMDSYHRFSVSMEVGYDVSWKQLSSDHQFEDFKDYRAKNEKPVTNLSYGIKFNYQYKNWVVGAGLDYTSVGEEINYDINETIVDPNGGYYDVDTVWAIIYDLDDNLVPMIIGYDRTWVEEYKDINYGVSNTNRYNYIEIPVSVGYRFAMRKFSICPTVGMSFGFLFSASGNLPLYDSTNFGELNEKSGYLEKSIANMSFSLGFEYSITPNYGVYIKPFYKQGLNSIYNNYPLSGIYRNAGVKFGINIYL